MNHFRPVDEALKAVEDARKVINRGRSRQVTSAEDCDHMKTVASLWFQRLKPKIVSVVDGAAIEAVDIPLKRIHDATAKAAARTTYKNSLREARIALHKLRQAMPTNVVDIATLGSDDNPPNFAPLASDSRMQAIMERRWGECVACIESGAYLAGVIMMGGLLESLFVSKQNRLSDKSPLIRAKRAPEKSGKKIPLQDWTLNHYIEVGNELKWIGDAAKSVGVALRDYRNFVHPQKEYAEQLELVEQDARLLWSITKALIRELLATS